MKEPYYTIKEASAKVGVESHVLRYWEEELKMDIHRNQMGHRYYTEHDIELFSMVRRLKDKGLQLKAIRSYIEQRKAQLERGEIYIAGKKAVLSEEHGASLTADGQADEQIAVSEQMKDGKNELVPMAKNAGIMSNAEKLEQFQRIMNRILSNAIQENNELIGKSAGEHAASAVVTQIQGMTKEQEERAEARYRKLDQTLREIQLARKEAAAANMRPVDRRRQQRLKRKGKQQTEEKRKGDVLEDMSSDSLQETMETYVSDAEQEMEAVENNTEA